VLLSSLGTVSSGRRSVNYLYCIEYSHLTWRVTLYGLQLGDEDKENLVRGFSMASLTFSAARFNVMAGQRSRANKICQEQELADTKDVVVLTVVYWP